MTSPSSLVSHAVRLVASSERLPQSGEEFLYFRDAHGGFPQAAQVAEQARELLGVLGVVEELKGTGLEAAVVRLGERLRARADAHAGLRGGAPSKPITATPTPSTSTKPSRPQDTFRDAPVDNSRAPWVPKVNATGADLSKAVADHVHVALGLRPGLGNPLEDAIRDAQSKVPEWLWDAEQKVFGPTRVAKAPTLQTTPFAWVDSEEAFNEMLAHLLDLDKHRAVAIDLEHHNMRSFLGFTCLMQISSETRDFVVDTIALRHLVPKLAPLFLSPKVVKVLHGADSDVEWLQRDFGLYVCQMFDTGQAARALGHASASLAHALQRFCRVKANKQHQRSDWRQRPLPEDMLQYAREDTHYLLSVFDEMRLELIHAKRLILDGGQEAPRNVDGVRLVLNRSADIACRAYEKPQFNVQDAMDIVDRVNGSGLRPSTMSDVQTRVLYALYDWRDATARREDESCHYIMSNWSLLRVVRNLSHTTKTILNDLDADAEYARANVATLVRVVEEAMMGTTREELMVDDRAGAGGGGEGGNEDVQAWMRAEGATSLRDEVRKRAPPALQPPMGALATPAAAAPSAPLEPCADVRMYVNSFTCTFPVPVPLGNSGSWGEVKRAKKAVSLQQATDAASAFFHVLVRKERDATKATHGETWQRACAAVMDEVQAETKRRRVVFEGWMAAATTPSASTVPPPPATEFEDQSTSFVSLSTPIVSVRERAATATGEPTPSSHQHSKKDKKHKRQHSEPPPATSSSTFAFTRELAESVGALVSSANTAAASDSAASATTVAADTKYKNPYLFKASKPLATVVSSASSKKHESQRR